jgi:glycosyltransferase involved in cell wall biosynthesis
LQLLYVGNCVATRALPLVFDALLRPGAQDCKLSIVGGGPAVAGWEKQVMRSGLADRVQFTGKVPYEKLPAIYAAADALVFPALRDSGGSALLEAMSRDLPVICLDWAGPGEMVDKNSGIKIPVDDPEKTVTALAEAFLKLKTEPKLGVSLAQAARLRAQSVFRWDEKYRLLRESYNHLLKE